MSSGTRLGKPFSASKTFRWLGILWAEQSAGARCGVSRMESFTSLWIGDSRHSCGVSPSRAGILALEDVKSTGQSGRTAMAIRPWRADGSHKAMCFASSKYLPTGPSGATARPIGQSSSSTDGVHARCDRRSGGGSRLASDAAMRRRNPPYTATPGGPAIRRRAGCRPCAAARAGRRPGPGGCPRPPVERSRAAPLVR